MAMILQQLSEIVQYLIGYTPSDALDKVWGLLNLHGSLQGALDHQGNAQVRGASFPGAQ